MAAIVKVSRKDTLEHPRPGADGPPPAPQTLPVHGEFDKLAAFMRERLAAREAGEGPRSPLAKLFSLGKGSARGAAAPEGGKLVVTKDDLEAFERAHPEVCFAIFMYQPPVMRACFVSRTFMLKGACGRAGRGGALTIKKGWHRVELEDGADPTDEERDEYYSVFNRMINRGCNGGSWGSKERRGGD